METRLAPSTVQDEAAIEPDSSFYQSTLMVDEQSLPETLVPTDQLLRRLASLPFEEPPHDLVERTLERCRAGR